MAITKQYVSSDLTAYVDSNGLIQGISPFASQAAFYASLTPGTQAVGLVNGVLYTSADGVTISAVGGGRSSNVVVVNGSTYAAIMSAVNSIINGTGSGTVYLPAVVGGYTLGGNTLPIVQGITYLGDLPGLDDQGQLFVTGTYLNCDGTASAFSVISSTKIMGAAIKNIGISGPAYGVQCIYNGASGEPHTQLMFDNVYVLNPSRWGFWIENFNMFQIGYLEVLMAGVGQFMFMQNGTWNGGNSNIKRLSGSSVNFWTQGAVFESLYGAINNIVLDSANCFTGNGTEFSPSSAYTTGNTGIVCADITKFAVGMPVTLPGQYSTGQLCFITSITPGSGITGTITCSNTIGGPDITMTATNASSVVNTYGFPSLQVVATSAVANITFSGTNSATGTMVFGTTNTVTATITAATGITPAMIVLALINFSLGQGGSTVAGITVTATGTGASKYRFTNPSSTLTNILGVQDITGAALPGTYAGLVSGTLPTGITETAYSVNTGQIQSCSWRGLDCEPTLSTPIIMQNAYGQYVELQVTYPGDFVTFCGRTVQNSFIYMQAGGIWDLDNSSYNNEYHGFATKNIGNAGLFGIIQNSAALANGVTTGKQGGLLNLRGYRGDAQPGDVYVNDPSRALALTCGLMLATAQITAGTYNVPPTPGTAGAYFSPSVYTFTGPASSILTLNGGYASSTTQPVNVSGNEQNIGLFQIIVNATANPVTIATQGGTQNIIGHGASGTTYTLAANTAAIFVSISNAGTGAWLVI